MDSDNDYEEMVTDQWTSGGCDTYDDEEHREVCRGNAGVYRVCMVTTLFFLILGLRVRKHPRKFGERWSLICGKTMWYLLGVAGTIFVPNEVFNDTGYLQFARIGGCLFILLQQIILIDVAYEWNDSWVARADACEREEFQSGRKWLARIIIACVVLYVTAIACLGVMFDEFKGCATNETFMSLTVVGIVVITVVQLLGEEGSLLTSACISMYAVWLCFMAVSKNPTEECNPLYGENNTLGITISSIFTVVSMSWMGWSLTVEHRLAQVESGDLVGAVTKQDGSSASYYQISSQQESADEKKENDASTELLGDSQSTTLNEPLLDEDENGDGVILEEDKEENNVGIVTDDESVSVASWEIHYGNMARRICLSIALLSTWTAVSLTSWGQIGANGDAANPEVGEVSMWMIITSQWVVLLLYTWSMVAPRLFPDREFA